MISSDSWRRASKRLSSIIFGNVLFAIVIVIGAFVIALFAARKPNIVNVDIGEKGVRVGNVLYPFKTLKSFWIDEEHREGARLILVSQKMIMPYIIIAVEHDDIKELGEFLDTKLKAEPYEESPFQVILDRLGL